MDGPVFPEAHTGWQLDSHMKEALVVTAFKKALMSRRSDAKGLIVHTDRGGQYEQSIQKTDCLPPDAAEHEPGR